MIMPTVGWAESKSRRYACIAPASAGADHLYSVSALTDQSGVVVERYGYDAYGEREIVGTPSGVDQPYGFTGRRLDGETGLLYFRARYHSNHLGQFLSRDPVGYIDGLSLYKGWFVPNQMDPTGYHIPWETFVSNEDPEKRFPHKDVLDANGVDAASLRDLESKYFPLRTDEELKQSAEGNCKLACEWMGHEYFADRNHFKFSRVELVDEDWNWINDQDSDRKYWLSSYTVEGSYVYRGYQWVYSYSTYLHFEYNYLMQEWECYCYECDKEDEFQAGGDFYLTKGLEIDPYAVDVYTGKQWVPTQGAKNMEKIIRQKRGMETR